MARYFIPAFFAVCYGVLAWEGLRVITWVLEYRG